MLQGLETLTDEACMLHSSRCSMIDILGRWVAAKRMHAALNSNQQVKPLGQSPSKRVLALISQERLGTRRDNHIISRPVAVEPPSYVLLTIVHNRVQESSPTVSSTPTDITHADSPSKRQMPGVTMSLVVSPALPGFQIKHHERQLVRR